MSDQIYREDVENRISIRDSYDKDHQWKIRVVLTEAGWPLVLVVKTRLINLEVTGLNLRVCAL